MKDYWGYNRTVEPNGTLVSSEHATFDLGGRMALVQQVSANYAQNIMPKFEAGSATLRWLTGQAQGVINMDKLVGKEGFFEAFAALVDSCGSLQTVKIGLSGDAGCAAAITPGGRTINYSGAVPAEVRTRFSAGQLEVQEGTTLRAAVMNVG
jgi:hypothetical protein